MYNFVGAWVARKQREIFGDINDEPTDPEKIQQLRQAVSEQLKVDYLVTGGWSQKASAECGRLLGSQHVHIATDSRQANGGKFGTIQDESTWQLSKDAAMVYYCANETVDGVEFPAFPKILEPSSDGKGPIVVADMSSNILTQKIPVRNFSAIFFGAQKNLGPTGVTLVVIKKSFLSPATPQPSAGLLRQLGLPVPPIIFQYETIAKNNSLYNTLSIFEYVRANGMLPSLLERPLIAFFQCIHHWSGSQEDVEDLPGQGRGAASSMREESTTYLRCR